MRSGLNDVDSIFAQGAFDILPGLEVLLNEHSDFSQPGSDLGEFPFLPAVLHPRVVDSAPLPLVYGQREVLDAQSGSTAKEKLANSEIETSLVVLL